MAMPIQRQSESFGAFDGGPRYARDYETRDLPEGLVNAIGRGFGVTAGMNDPRGQQRLADMPGAAPGVDLSAVGGGMGAGMPAPSAPAAGTPSTAPPMPGGTGMGGAPAPSAGSTMDTGSQAMSPDASAAPGTPPSSAGGGTFTGRRRHAVDTRGMDPASHAYHTEEPFSPYDSQGGGRDWDPNTGYQPSGYDEQQSERVHGDDDSGYNWGPEPQHHEDLRPAPATPGFGFGGYDDYDPHSAENLPPDEEAQFAPHMASFGEARPYQVSGPATGLKTAAPAVQEQVAQPGWVGHGYVPGHRVGLPWRDQVIPGTVTHLDGQQLGVRWDDGQHSTEEPADLRPL